MPKAPYWRRTLAFLLDWTVALLTVWAVSLPTGQEPVGAMWALVLIAVISVQTSLGLLRSGAQHGQTLGKQLLGIRVVHADGAPLTGRAAALREAVLKYFLLVYVLIVLTNAVAGVVVIAWYVWPLVDPRRVAPHDLICNTRVVRA